MCNGIDIFLLRQIFVVFATFLYSFGSGVIHAFPSALNPSLLSPNGTDIRGTADQASWIAASDGMAGILGLIILIPFAQKFGRRTIFLVLIAIRIIEWIVLVFAANLATLFAARIIGGLGGEGFIISAVLIGEYSHRTRRGCFTAMKKVFGVLGALACHALTLCCTWRQIAAIALLFSVLSGIIMLLCPESPSYLAMKGKFEECEKSFVWLNGDSLESQTEMKELIAAQKERIQKTLHGKNSNILSKCVNAVKDRGLLRAVLIASILSLVVDACGRFYFMAYVIQIMTEITGDISIAVYYSVGADVLIIVALLLSCFVISYFKRRTLLLGFGGFSTFLMFAVGLLKLSLSQFGFVKWLIASVILLQNFVIYVSVIPVCYTLFGELFPLEYRGLGPCLAGLVLKCFYSVTMKFTPKLIDTIGIEGTYATYGTCLLVCFIILFFILIETKDKTLQNIEDEIKGVKRSRAETKPMLESL